MVHAFRKYLQKFVKNENKSGNTLLLICRPYLNGNDFDGCNHLNITVKYYKIPSYYTQNELIKYYSVPH